MKTLDLKKQFKYLYQPSAKKIEVVQVPNLQFAMIDGAIEKGSEPGKSPAFAEATQALYSISYTLKFTFKKRKTNPIDYPVMALEGLWWVEDGNFDITVKDNWFYTLMIMQPDVVTQEIFKEAREEVRRKKGDSDMLGKLRLAHFEEGLCVQTMHIGPYATEPATIDRMKEFMEENGLKDSVGPIGGKHHEIYISDPRKAAPDKMKTVLRHPVVKE
ncbi:MAG: GyrI-like domain-containing protein [Chloroflexi bacterium]|nr:GyrI-like domain-containing protein [Chloroflexota bacterium]